ncbi:MAG: ComF family protein [Steroidobacter sp.]
MVYQFLQRVQRTLFTSTCIACGQRGSHALDLCDPCRSDLVFNHRYCQRCAIPLQVDDAGWCGACLRLPPRYHASYCAFKYGYPVDEFVRSLKYGHSLSHANVLATLLAEYLKQRRHHAWPDCFVPVPLSPPRYHDRGFNQAIELGRVVEKSLGIPMNTRLLERVRHTIEQAGLSRRERRKNLRNAFAVIAKEIPNHVAILDDVVTTGSTMNEITRVLRRAGVEQIEVWAVARAPLK